jgi:prepilin peptidase CpaA
MVFAALFDLMTMTIPNRISLGLLAAFLVAAPVAGLPLNSILTHLGVGLAVLAAGIVLFELRVLGGGDAKLLAAASLWIGSEKFLPYIAQVAIIGGVLALTVLVYRRLPVATLPLPGWALRLHKKESGIPYGLAIAGAAVSIYPQTPWFAAFTT